MARTFTLLAAVFGLLAVLAGTFGAHGLKGRLDIKDLEIWETAVRYQMFHAAALLGVAWASERFPGRLTAWAGRFFAAGIVVFSGSLYLLALSTLVVGTRQGWLGMVTPLGGVCFMVGWSCLLLGAWKAKSQMN